MISGVKTSLSGLRAASKAIGIAASNIVNAHDTLNAQDAAVLASASGRRSGGEEEAPMDHFRPHEVHYETAAGGGVSAIAQQVDPPYVFSFAPGDPNADADGMVVAPNVNIMTEMVRVMQAETLYKANAKVLKAEDRMLGATVNNRV